MSTQNRDPRLDRLYKLLPAIYRMRDADQQYPLRALLRVIAEQVDVVEDDIAQLYANWFIETADDWTVPYIADLIGYRRVSEAGPASDDTTSEGRELNRVLIPRREVANTLRYRRRKGTLALLELLAHDVTDWPARAVEFYKLLGWNQNLGHQHLRRARTVDLRAIDALDRIDGPFDELAHIVDIRRISSHRPPGRYNIPSVGLFAWRLKPFPVTNCPAFCAETEGSKCYTFSVLGQDTPLFIRPEAEPSPTHIAEEMNVPAMIRRQAFAQAKNLFYGEDRSFAIYVEGWGSTQPGEPVPVDAIIPADLSEWQYLPPRNCIALDPMLGRFVFPSGGPSRKSVRVSYHYGFSAAIGGGEYPRRLMNPVPRAKPATTSNGANPGAQEATIALYQVGKGQTFDRLSQAVNQWAQDQPLDAVVELCDSSVYSEPLALSIPGDSTLQIRAANRTRPVLRLMDWQTDLPDALSVTMAAGSRLTLDGLLITGRSLQITGPAISDNGQPRAPICGSSIVIRHCTFVPGWGISCDCEPQHPADPSLELFDIRARVHIDHSIIGSIQVHENEVTADPIPITITDSILDATAPEKEALGAALIDPQRDPSGLPRPGVAHVVLTIQRCTVFGIVNVHAIKLAENSIFTNCLNVARRQLGCMRFCSVPSGCRTPRRYHCQPDLVIQAVKETISDLNAQANAIAGEELRVEPQFTSVRFGAPAYAQLGRHCAPEITRGADDESEMGVFHDLFQPQREANLLARLEEFTPAGMDVGIIFVT